MVQAGIAGEVNCCAVLTGIKRDRGDGANVKPRMSDSPPPCRSGVGGRFATADPALMNAPEALAEPKTLPALIHRIASTFPIKNVVMLLDVAAPALKNPLNKVAFPSGGINWIVDCVIGDDGVMVLETIPFSALGPAMLRN